MEVDQDTGTGGNKMQVMVAAVTVVGSGAGMVLAVTALQTQVAVQVANPVSVAGGSGVVIVKESIRQISGIWTMNDQYEYKKNDEWCENGH